MSLMKEHAIPDTETLSLIDRCRRGDTLAENLLFHHFNKRLIMFIRTRIPLGLAHRFGAEDIAQLVFTSLFRAIRDNRITIRGSGDLWARLAGMAFNKILHQTRQELALKRSPAVENRWDWVAEPSAGDGLEAAAREPSAHEVLAIVEELDLLYGPVGAPLRRVVDMRLQEMTQEEIAERMGTSHTTIGRHLRKIATLLEARQRLFETSMEEEDIDEPDARRA